MSREVLEHELESGCKVECCRFQWQVKNFGRCAKAIISGSLATLQFTASKDYNATSWNVELTSKYEDAIDLSLTRLESGTKFSVFAHFYASVLDRQRSSCFGGSIYSTFSVNDTYSMQVAETVSLLRKKHFFFPDGYLNILCELSVYERKAEDFISDRAKAKVPYGIRLVAEDMEKLLQKKTFADAYIATSDEMIKIHKAILSARCSVLTHLMKNSDNENCLSDLETSKSGVLYALLKHLYSGSVDLYFKHTIPNGLCDIAQKCGLLDLQQHLKTVCSYNIPQLRSIDVTWKIPQFSTYCGHEIVRFFCPDRDSVTLYDNRWQFVLEMKDCDDYVGVYVIRNQEGDSYHQVQFTVKVPSPLGLYDRSAVLEFKSDGILGIPKFIDKSRLFRLLMPKNTLKLKCSLVILRCVYPHDTSYPGVNENHVGVMLNAANLFTKHVVTSFQKMSHDMKQLFLNQNLSDAVVETSCGKFSIHSFLVEARFLTPMQDLNAFLRKLEPVLAQSFFTFLYEGTIHRELARDLLQAAKDHEMSNIASKVLTFLVSINSTRGTMLT